METFFSDEDLVEILKELDDAQPEEEELDEEMEASQKRYEDIIKKHKQ